jgi:hypothetical protein
MTALKLNKTLMAELLLHLESLDQTTACELVGITYNTLYNWRKKGKKDHIAGEDTIYAELWLHSQKARGIMKKPVVDSVRREAIRGNPASQKMLLQATDRRTWGDKVEVNAEIEKALDKIQEVVTPEVFNTIMEALEE